MRLKDMHKAIKMKKHNISEAAIRHFDDVMLLVDTDYAVTEPKFVEKMDELLTEEQRLLLWEYGGSCRGGETGREAKKLGQSLEGKSLSEKIDVMNQNEHMFKSHLNEDGTITVYCFCHCLQHRFNNPENAKASSAYGCAAGAHLAIIKSALGVKLKIKSVDYPQKNDGKQFMTCVLEVID